MWNLKNLNPMIESRLVVARGRRVGEMGDGALRVQTANTRRIRSEVLMYSMVTVVSNTALYT